MTARLRGRAVAISATTAPRVALLGVLAGVALARSGAPIVLLEQMATWSIAAAGLWFVLGLADQPSLCQASFLLVGGYAYAVVSRSGGIGAPPVLGLLAALGAAAALGLVASPLLRVRGFRFALATIALDLLVHTAARTGTWLPGGSVGLDDTPAFSLGPLGLGTPLGRLALALVVLLAVVAAVHAVLRRAPRRRLLAALAADESLLASVGRNPMSTKRVLFVVAAGLGGIAGALLSAGAGFVGPASFPVTDSFTLAVAVIFGGRGRLLGAICGAVFFQTVPVLLGESQAAYRPAALGLAVIICVRFFPDGLVPASARRQTAASSGRRERTRRPRRAVAGAPTPVDGGATVDLVGVTQTFGALRAVDAVDLTLERGTVTGLVGPNGAGKSTLLDVIASRAPTAGAVVLDGVDITSMSASRRARRGVTRTFQVARVLPRGSIVENIALGVDLAGLAGHEVGDDAARDARAAEVASLVGLDPDDRRSASALSLAELHLLEIGRSIASEPRFAVLDEPASGLDTAGRAALVAAVGQLSLGGCTVLVVEHDLSFVEAVATTAAALDNGRLIRHGPVDQVLDEPAFVRTYFGLSRS